MSRESEITAFIAARLDEEEMTAIAATRGPWKVTAPRGYPQRITNDRATLIAETYMGPEVPPHDANHIICQDPNRTFRKIRALRNLMKAHVGYYGPDDDEYLPVPTLSLIASIWDDHEDYANAVKAGDDV
jgi:hypothetical protein